jgi:hypothetical protein
MLPIVWRNCDDLIAFPIKYFIPDLGRAVTLRRFVEGLMSFRDGRVAAEKRTNAGRGLILNPNSAQLHGRGSTIPFLAKLS